MSTTNYYKPYSLAEMRVMTELYPKGSKETILAALPGRTWKALSRLASSMGVSRRLPANYSRGWSAEHIEIMRANYPGKGAAFVANLIGKPTRTVLSYASQHGIRRDLGELRRRLGRPPRVTDWTRAQDALLKKLYATAPREEIQVALPGLSWTGICSRANRLKLVRQRAIGATWSESELQLLRSLYGSLPLKVVREQLPGRSEQGIRCKALLLGLTPAPRGSKPVSKPAPKAAPRVVTRKAVAAPKPPVVVLAPVKRPPAAPKVADLHITMAPDTAKHRPAPDNGLKPLITKVSARKPASLASKTPNANAQRAARLAAEQKAAEKSKGYVSAETIRGLDPTHPARLAYTKGAYNGMAAAQQAYHEAMRALQTRPA